MGGHFAAAEPTKKTAKILFSVSGGNIKEIQGGSVHRYGITGEATNRHENKKLPNRNRGGLGAGYINF